MGLKQIPKVNWQGKTVLIVEDENHNFFYLKETIKRTGASCLRAINGLEAIKIFKDNKDIEIVLMDIKMPVMDGYEATRRIKEINPEIPVIAQTARAMVKEKEKSIEAGCDAYIVKPYEPADLIELMMKFIKT